MLEYLAAHLPHFNPDRQVNSFAWDEKIHEAEQVLKQCIIVVLEDWNTSTNLVETAVPWLQGYLSEAQSKNVAKSRSDHEQIGDFPPELALALQTMLHGDLTLYNKATEIYHAQLSHFGIKPSQQSMDGESHK